MKRKSMSKKSSKKLFYKTANNLNSKNKPTMSRGGIRF